MKAPRSRDGGARSAEYEHLRRYSSAVLSWVLAGLCVWMGFAALGVVLAGFGVLVFRMLRRHHRTAGLVVPLVRARQALDAGDVARCETLLEQLEAARPPLKLELWIGILRAHVAFNQGDATAAANALSKAIDRANGTLHATSGLVAILLALRALAFALLEEPERARADLATHDAHPERTADTVAPTRLAEALLLNQSGEKPALTELVGASAAALLNRIGPAQRSLVRSLVMALDRGDDADRTARDPSANPPRASRSTGPAQIAIRNHPMVRRMPRLKGALTVAALGALIVGGFWLPQVLAWQGLGIALLAVVAFAVYGTMSRRGQLQGTRQLQAARMDLVWGDRERGYRSLVALASGRNDDVAVDACVHLAIDAEERGDLAAALDACDAGLARIESSRSPLDTQQWTAPKLTELQAYLRAAQGQLDRSQRELAALRATYPEYAFLIAGVHRVRLMQAAHARDWREVARLDAKRAPAMTVSARDDLLARVGCFLADGATPSDLAQLRAELAAFPSHERWLDAVVPGALNELQLGNATPGPRLPGRGVEQPD